MHFILVSVFQVIKLRFTGCGFPQFMASPPFFNVHGRLSECSGLLSPESGPCWAER